VVTVDEWVWVTDDGERPVAVPVQLDLPDAPVDYRLRSEVELPAALRDGPLDLSIPYFGACPTLTVDGEPAVQLDGDADQYRSGPPLRWRIPAEATADGRLALELTVPHRWPGSGRLEVAPRLLRSGTFDRATVRARVFHLYFALAAMVALMQVGLTCVAIFLLDRRRLAYLWFGIQALFALYYPAYVAGLTAFLGTWDLIFLPTTLIGATHVAALFTHTYFDLPRPSKWFLVSGVGGTAVSWVVWLATDSWRAVHWIAPLLITILAITIGYQIVVCARLVRQQNRPRAAMLLAACWIAVASTAWPDFASWLGLGEWLGGTHTATLGLTLFAFFLSLLLGRGHIRSLNRSDELNVALADQVSVLETRGQEIERLNVELRRQIEERSAQIMAALTVGNKDEQAGELAADEVVQGRYRVVRRLGRGGMGAVYEVVRESDGQRLALKVAQHVRGLALARLAREAQIACRVDHPNVVRVHDVDVAPNGYVFVVMELVRGVRLDELKVSERPRAFWLEVLRQVAEGLTALHAAGIVHRDLKPANVMVTSEAEHAAVKIVDFGISRMLDDPTELEETAVEVPRHLRRRTSRTADDLPSIVRALTRSVDGQDDSLELDLDVTEDRCAPAGRPSLTRPGEVPGTPPYLAPELMLPGAPVTVAADVFSFGVLAYQRLTGVRPFHEPAAFVVLDGREVPDPPDVTVGCAGLDPYVASAIMRCLSVAPADRPTAAELAEVLAL